MCRCFIHLFSYVLKQKQKQPKNDILITDMKWTWKNNQTKVKKKLEPMAAVIYSINNEIDSFLNIKTQFDTQLYN